MMDKTMDEPKFETFLVDSSMVDILSRIMTDDHGPTDLRYLPTAGVCG